MTITAASGSSTISIKNVLFGEVWVCSGQSNIEYRIGTTACWMQINICCFLKGAQCGYGCCNQCRTEIKGMKGMSNYPDMRLLHFPRPPQKSRRTIWPRSPAACWFFGRGMFSKHKPRRPVSLIETLLVMVCVCGRGTRIVACKGPSPWN